MLAEQVEIARLDVRLGRDLGYIVRVDQAAPDAIESILAGEIIQ